MSGDISRRQALLTASTGVVGGALAPLVLSSSVVTPTRKRVYRIAHLTDIHVQPEKQAAKGLELALEKAQETKPDAIFTGGDLIMDALGQEKDRVAAQWKIFSDVTKANLSVPIEHCIGNHDVWGWNDWTKWGSESKFGKTWAQEVLELPKTYRALERGGWKVLVLDSTHRKEGNGYTARLDEDQFGWLSDQLKNSAGKPVLVVSHIPILGVSPFLDGDNEKSGDWRVPGAWMHIDARRIKDLFKQHPNVKLCISGHIHLIDKVDYLGVQYHCLGAVSAGWWGGDYQECTYGFSLIDLFDDGSFETAYVPYGWKTAK